MNAAQLSLASRAHRVVTNLVGAAIGLVSPAAACRYYRSRSSFYAVQKRGYEGGQPGGPNGNWRPANKSADAEIRRDGDRLKARARDLARNDGRIVGAIGAIQDNVVFTGIWPQAQFETISGEPSRRARDAVEALWRSWAPRADVTGGSIYAQQRLAVSHLWQDGEFLVREVWNNKFSVLPLRFELIETDQLDASVDGVLPNGNVARRGVEYDKFCRQAAFHILPYHPGDAGLHALRSFGKSERVPASECRLVFRRERISQSRGVSWLASVVMRAFDLTEYDSYEMVGAKLAAAFGVFFTQSPVDGLDTFDGAPASGKPMPEYIDPGMMRTLPPGSDVKIAEHNRPGDNYDEFQRQNQQVEASGMRLAYETLSGDYRGSSYASSRQAILGERKGYRCQQDFLCENMLSWMWERFLLACVLSGKASLPGFEACPERYVDAVAWQTPGWSWVDPLKDAKASESKINLGISSRTREAREQGADFDECVAEQLREEEQLLALARLRAERRKLESPAKNEPAPAAADPKEAGNASA